MGLSQNFYYYKGNKQSITLDKTGFSIYVNEGFQSESLSDGNLKPFDLNVLTPNAKWANVEFVIPPTDSEYYSRINEFKTDENSISVQPRFLTTEGNVLNLSNYLFVKLKKADDLSILQSIAINKNFIIVNQNEVEQILNFHLS
jgi:hypothetical protein